MVEPFNIWLANLSYAGLSVDQLEGKKPQHEQEKTKIVRSELEGDF